ncbi:MAG TPA: PKD domain-containing protein [Tepidisphaeraceae bacterium]
MKKQANVVKTHKAVVETLEGRTLLSSVNFTGTTLAGASDLASANHLNLATVVNGPAAPEASLMSANADSAPAVQNLVLWDVEANKPVMWLWNGCEIDLAKIGASKVTIVANTTGAKSIAFGMDNNGGMFNANSSPFSFAGDTNGKLNAYNFPNGSHTVMATPFSGQWATGWAGSMYRLSFTVKNSGWVPQTAPPPVTNPTPAPTSGPAVNNLVLYNVDTNQPIMTLWNGCEIDYAKIGTSRVTIVAQTSSAKSVAFGMDNNGGMYNDNSSPFSFNGETNGALNAYTFPNGSHTLMATPFSGQYATGSAGSMYKLSFTVKNSGTVYTPPPVQQPAPQPSSSGPSVNSLVLYNADTNQPIMTLSNGAVIDYSAIGTNRVSIVAQASGTQSIAFGMDGNGGMFNDNGSPFAFNGDTGGKVNAYTFSAGSHTLMATPFSGAYATGAAGSMYKLTFTVTSGNLQPNNNPTPPPVTNNVGAPVAVISAIDTSVQAGHSIFVNATSSQLVSGDWIHSKVEWDFGDANSKYNKLSGFNAAHVYERPGNYTIAMKLTNQAGKSTTTYTNVTVTEAARRVIYVSQWGNDNNSGSSPQTAVQSFARASQLLSDNTEILFERGGTFNVNNAMNVGRSNVVIGSYGSGEKPVVRYTGVMRLGAQIITMNSAARHVTVRDITFDSVGGARDYDGMAQAVAPAGSDITIRDCQFLNLADAICANGKPTGLLVQDNTAPLGTRGYFAWVEGSDQAYIGNTVADSMYQHCLRNEGTDRLLIAFNNFSNPAEGVIKGTLNLHKGTFMWVTGNKLNSGTMSIGPLGGGDGLNNKDWRATNVVLEYNQINSDVQILHGAEHIMCDNNVVWGETNFRVDGWNSAYNRGVIDLNIINNTGINSGDHGNFLLLNGEATDVTVTNNLYVAPNLVTGQWGAAPVYVTDNDLSSFRVIKDNVWPAVNAITWAEGGSNFIGTSMVAGGYRTPAEWESWSQVEHDQFQNVGLAGKWAQQNVNGTVAGAYMSIAA